MTISKLKLKQKKMIARSKSQDRIYQLIVRKSSMSFSQICRALNKKLYDDLNRHKAIVLYDLNRLQLSGRIFKEEKEDKTIYQAI